MSLGGKQTTTQSIDPALREAALENLAMAKRVGQLGFVPYTEATVAGMSPSQIAAIQNTNAGASAFGLTPSAVPTGGDLSPYQMYQTALNNMAPGQRAFIEAMFIDPMTGKMAGAAPAAAQPAAAAPSRAPQDSYRDRQELKALQGGGRGAVRTGGGTGSFGLPDPMSGGFAGTNLPGLVGGVVNTVTRALAPRTAPPALRATNTASPAKSSNKSSKPTNDSGARR